MEYSQETAEKKIAKFNSILLDVIDFVYYDLSEHEKAFLLTHVKTKHRKQITEIAENILSVLGEFFVRREMMTMMLNERFEQMLQDEYKRIIENDGEPEN